MAILRQRRLYLREETIPIDEEQVKKEELDFFSQIMETASDKPSETASEDAKRKFKEEDVPNYFNKEREKKYEEEEKIEKKKLVEEVPEKEVLTKE